MDMRGVLEPVVARWFAEPVGVPAARLTCRMVRELVDELLGGLAWRHLRIPASDMFQLHLRGFKASTMPYGRWLAGRLARVPGWAASCLAKHAIGDAHAAVAQPEADAIVCGALHELCGNEMCESHTPHRSAVALLEQLRRVCGRAHSWSACAHVAAWRGDVVVLDWLWEHAVGDRSDVSDVCETTASVHVLRWAQGRATRRATPNANVRAGYHVMRSALKRGDVELARAYVEATRCLGRQVAWVFNYALALEEHGGASTLPILRMIADRFRIKHIRAEARGRIDHADRALRRRSETVAWLVERFGLDDLVAPTRWRDEWVWMGHQAGDKP